MHFIHAVLFVLLVLPSNLAFISQDQKPAGNEALNQLVETEKAFARMSVEKGIRESFITFFSDDGINFQPNPTLTKQSMQKRPAASAPFPVTLNWQPVYADVSAAGDLGYTTGPFTLVTNSDPAVPTRYGFYFSIWKRQIDDSWKVEVDSGISVPGIPEQNRAQFHAALPTGFKSSMKTSNESERRALISVENSNALVAASKGTAFAYSRMMSSDVRLHREGMQPMIGRALVVDYMAKQGIGMIWVPIKCEVAKSLDLAYTYGTYKLTDLTSKKTTETGYYVRVWKKQLDGTWKITLDTTSRLP